MPGLESGAIYTDYMPRVVDIRTLSAGHYVFDYDRQYVGGVD